MDAIVNFLRDEAVFRAASLIVPIIVALIGLYGVLGARQDGGLRRFTTQTVVITTSLVLLSLFVLVPLGYSFYNRSQQKGYEFRMKRSDDVAFASSVLDWQEEIERLNDGLHFKSVTSTYLIFGNDGYKLGEYNGSVLPHRRNDAAAHNFYLPYLSESGAKPKEMFVNMRTKQVWHATEVMLSSPLSGSKGRWRFAIPGDEFSMMSFIEYPDGAKRRDEADYIVFGLFYKGGVERFDFGVVLDTKLFQGDMGLFRVHKEFGLVRLFDIPLDMNCEDSNLKSVQSYARRAYEGFFSRDNRLGRLMKGFEESRFRQACNFSLGSIARGVFAFVLKRPSRSDSARAVMAALRLAD